MSKGAVRDISGNKVSFTDGNQNKTSLAYSDNYSDGTNRNTYALLTQITYPKAAASASSQVASWQYDYNTGKVTQATDVNSVNTNYAFNDPLERVTQIVKAAGTSAQSQTNAVYSAAGTVPLSVDVFNDQTSSGDEALHASTVYDGLGRESQKLTYESASSSISTAKTYDALGRVSTTSNPSRGNDGLGYLTNYYYDALSRPTAVTTADGATTCYSYANYSNSACPAPSNSPAGDWTLVQDQAGKQKQMWNDALGRLTEVIEDPGSTSSHFNYVTTYAYDGLGDLLAVNQSGLMRSFSYDARKHLIAANNPENASASVTARLSCAGATSAGPWTTCYSYDAVGNLLAKTDNNNVTTAYAYDGLNRVTYKSYAGGPATPAVAYCYDGVYNSAENAICRNAPAPSFALGRLTETYNSNSATLHTGFDALGRVTASVQSTAATQNTSAQTYSFAYGYNLAGSLTSETYPSGRVVNTCYDLVNRVSEVGGTSCSAANSGAPVPGAYASYFQYAPHGAPTQYALGNGLWHEPTYNSRLQMSGWIDLVNNNTGDELLNVTLNWGASNNNGNLQGSIYGNGGPGYPSFLVFVQTYNYDSANRLTSASDNGGWSRTFHYDPFGNMWVDPSYTGLQLNPNTPTSNTYNGNNQRGDTGQSYDAAGNLTGMMGGVALGYDAENRQTSVGGYTYSYDGDGRRVVKAGASGTTVYAYDAMGELAAEYSTVGNTSPCATCYLTSDHLGTARLITDSSAGVVSRHDYLPFGEEIPAGTAGRDSHWGPFNDAVSEKFTGKERDSESGLDYFGARYYGSALGRFTSPDWSAIPQPVPYADLNNPQSLNLYMYLGDNPLARIDPDGHADGPCKTGTPGCTNGVQQSSTGAPLAFDKNDKRNQKAADANPAFLAPEKNGQTGGKGGGEIAYKLNRSPGDTTHYTVIQAESNAGRVTAVSDFGGNVSLGPRDNHFIDSIDTGADPLQGRSNSVQTFFMVPLDKNGNCAGPPQPVNVKDSQGNVFNSLGVYFTGPGGQAFVNSHAVTDPSFLPPSSQGTNQ